VLAVVHMFYLSKPGIWQLPKSISWVLMDHFWAAAPLFISIWFRITGSRN
jgi:hypothetical protein